VRVQIKTPEYEAWQSMKARCLNPRHRFFKHYGGRGIKVCEQWRQSFANFVADMGPRPSPDHSLDRIDNNGHYGPGNCRWVTQKEQCNNRRSNHHVTFNGETRTISQWAEVTGILKSCIRLRLKAGWSIEAALTTPSRATPNPKPFVARALRRLCDGAEWRMGCAEYQP
jgi:hypothetical protein